MVSPEGILSVYVLLRVCSGRVLKTRRHMGATPDVLVYTRDPPGQENRMSDERGTPRCINLLQISRDFEPRVLSPVTTDSSSHQFLL